MDFLQCSLNSAFLQVFGVGALVVYNTRHYTSLGIARRFTS